jgi:hypothetical protein
MDQKQIYEQNRAVREAFQVSEAVKNHLRDLVRYYVQRMRQGLDIAQLLRISTVRQAVYWAFHAHGTWKAWEKLDETTQAEYYQAAAEIGPPRYLGRLAKCVFYFQWVLENGEDAT